MTKWSLSVALVLLVGLSTSCGGAATRLHVPGEASEINNVYDSVVALVRVSNNQIQGPYCTAAFIGPRLLATAAHCVPAQQTITVAPGVTIILPGTQEQSPVGQLVQLVTHEQYYSWVRSSGENHNIPEYTTATVVVVDDVNDHDVALLELVAGSPDAAHWLEMRNLEHEPLLAGEEAYSIGMPVGQIWILTDGIISRVHIRLNATIDILHQVRIGPGSSGSPLMDQRGRMTGVNSAGWGTDRSGTVLGQAKPVSYVQTMIRVLTAQREIEMLASRFEEQNRSGA